MTMTEYIAEIFKRPGMGLSNISWLIILFSSSFSLSANACMNWTIKEGPSMVVLNLLLIVFCIYMTIEANFARQDVNIMNQNRAMT